MSEASVLTSKLAAISNAFTLENRFKKNFEIMSQIGIGGFAKVVKARNHLDDMEYAIKKIKIETRNKSASEIVNELDQILTEIRCFAKIKHKHIVRYNHSWIEVKLKENQTNDQSNKENKLMKNTDNINKKIKTQINNCKKSTKQQKSDDHSDSESSGGDSYNFTDESYECEISWEGIEQSDNFKPNEKEYKKLDKETEKVSSFDPSFYLEQEENDSLPFDYNKNEKICAEYECEFSEFDFQAIGKIKNNIKTINKRYALEDEYDCNDSENDINFVKSISRINKISEDCIYDLTHKNIKRSNKNDMKAILKNETDELKVHVNEKEYKFSQIKKFTIFLQMELCKQTLEDFLREKIVSKNFAGSSNTNIHNFICNSNASVSYHKEILEKLDIFLEITKAINYLHESENIIHRDIKPQNIFFSIDGNVKLGDFGLATNFHNEKYNEIENLKNRKNSLESKATTVTRSSSPPTYTNTEFNNKINSNENCTFYHTKNVGTLLYSSPEQLNDNFYDYKSDVYSMGLILFELLHPFKTQMEKNMKFEQIKKGKIPPSLHSEEPVLAKLILAMCEPNRKQRPNTNEIMKILLKEISNKYFLVLESNAPEEAELLSLKDFEYQNYFRASSKNLSVNSLNFGENVDFKTYTNTFQAENFVDLDLKKASSYDICDGKLDLLRNTFKFIKKTEDFCVDITNDEKNLRLFSVKDFQEIKSRKFEKVMLSNANSNKTLTKSVNLPVEEIQNKRLRLLNSEIEANYNKENVNTNNIPFGIGYLFEKEYETKEKKNSEKQIFKNLQEKNKVFIRMFENNLLLFHRPNSNKADKVFDLLESRVNIKPNVKNNLTQLSLEIPFFSSVYIFLENSKENNEIIKRIKHENFLN